MVGLESIICPRNVDPLRKDATMIIIVLLLFSSPNDTLNAGSNDFGSKRGTNMELSEDCIDKNNITIIYPSAMVTIAQIRLSFPRKVASTTFEFPLHSESVIKYSLFIVVCIYVLNNHAFLM